MRTTFAATALAAVALITTALFPPATAGAAAPAAAAVPAGAAVPAAAPVRLGDCASGQLCLWAKPDFTGARLTHELSTIDIESCVPLKPGTTAQSLANRTGRPVTTYQSAECQETGEFETYPGGGTWLPRSPYQVRAFKVWEN
ncbi:peptidase inhibitor family I36 protein [Streptomyces sp. NBC_00525]|uniref:peptidase inhibitor family I36 protein n=1 Tax=Streptomyces sp. NBC_00525 TaxID=2903660 RepID=UPI002E803252|nr:peptidase inhibitor family I36 protein [Streptomyces sp. NBC_00525]WUC93493.1 peptidase inhibitor family I36 protein [Streptomyces sp. NBC_00525]